MQVKQCIKIENLSKQQSKYVIKWQYNALVVVIAHGNRNSTHVNTKIHLELWRNPIPHTPTHRHIRSDMPSAVASLFLTWIAEGPGSIHIADVGGDADSQDAMDQSDQATVPLVSMGTV